MKTKTFITVFAGIFISQIISHAQSFYAGAGGGYGFPSMVQSFTSNSTSNGTSTTYTSQSVSLGSGVTVGVYGGYMICKNFGLELGISDKFGSSTSTTETYSDAAISSSTIYTAKGSLFRLTPAMRIMTGDGKLKEYMVTGLIIGFPSATLEENGTSTSIPVGGTNSVTNTSDEISTYSGGIIIGFHGAAGVVYMVSDKIGIFGEIAGNFQTWAPSQELITTDTYNGADQLSKLTTSQKQTNFVSSYSITSGSSSPGSPTQSTKMYLPFSSFGIDIGVHFSFGGGSNATVAATPK